MPLWCKPRVTAVWPIHDKSMTRCKPAVPATIKVLHAFMTTHLGKSTSRAHLQLLGMALLWGASWPLGRALGQTMPPLTAASWRFTIASVVLLVWLRWSRGAWPRLSLRQAVVIGLGGAFGVFGYGMFFMLGLAQVPAGRAALVVTINPVFTTLFAAWLFKERFDWRVGLGMALSVLGAAFVLTHGQLASLLEGQVGKGEWLLLGCIACWVMYSLLGKRSMQGIDPLTVTTYTAVVGTSLLWLSSSLLEPHQATSGLSGHALVLLLAMALGPTVLAYAWYFEGIAHLGAGTASSYISLVPIFGVLMATLTLGETLDMPVVIGGAMAIGGLVWMNWARQLKRSS